MLVYNQKTIDKEFCGGFLLSYQKGLPEGGNLVETDGTYRANSPSGAYGSRTYAVFYDNPEEGQMPEKDMIFTQSYYGTCGMNSCMVNNTALVAGKVKEHFEVGDKLVLKATGYLDGTKTGESEFVLAEFSSQKDSIVSTWTRFDLSKLGLLTVSISRYLHLRRKFPDISVWMKSLPMCPFSPGKQDFQHDVII